LCFKEDTCRKYAASFKTTLKTFRFLILIFSIADNSEDILFFINKQYLFCQSEYLLNFNCCRSQYIVCWACYWRKKSWGGALINLFPTVVFTENITWRNHSKPK